MGASGPALEDEEQVGDDMLPAWVAQAWPSGYLGYICTKQCQSGASVRRVNDELDHPDALLPQKLLAECRLFLYAPNPWGKAMPMPIAILEVGTRYPMLSPFATRKPVPLHCMIVVPTTPRVRHTIFDDLKPMMS